MPLRLHALPQPSRCSWHKPPKLEIRKASACAGRLATHQRPRHHNDGGSCSALQMRCARVLPPGMQFGKCGWCSWRRLGAERTACGRPDASFHSEVFRRVGAAASNAPRHTPHPLLHAPCHLRLRPHPPTFMATPSYALRLSSHCSVGGSVSTGHQSSCTRSCFAPNGRCHWSRPLSPSTFCSVPALSRVFPESTGVSESPLPP